MRRYPPYGTLPLVEHRTTVRFGSTISIFDRIGGILIAPALTPPRVTVGARSRRFAAWTRRRLLSFMDERRGGLA